MQGVSTICFKPSEAVRLFKGFAIGDGQGEALVARVSESCHHLGYYQNLQAAAPWLAGFDPFRSHRAGRYNKQLLPGARSTVQPHPQSESSRHATS